MVLLKNDDILPLKRNKQKIALIGPYADSLDIVGMWAVHADHKHSLHKQAMEMFSIMNTLLLPKAVISLMIIVR